MGRVYDALKARRVRAAHLQTNTIFSWPQRQLG